jgi:hypothetical protein
MQGHLDVEGHDRLKGARCLRGDMDIAKIILESV